MIKLELQKFAGGHSVTVAKGTGITTATASSTSDVQANAEVTLTITPTDGYKAIIEVIAGGVTVNPTTKKFTMGTSDVVIVVKGQKTNLYKITENTPVCINGTKTELVRNLVLEKGPSGAIVGVKTDGTEVTINPEIVEELLKTGALVAM